MVPICLREEVTNPCLPSGSATDQIWTSCKQGGKDVAHLLSRDPADWIMDVLLGVLCEERGFKS